MDISYEILCYEKKTFFPSNYHCPFRPFSDKSDVCFILLIGTKRFDSEKAGDREVQRTMLELLNQLDGFQPNSNIKVGTSKYDRNVPF